ncbi:MAG: NAD(P)H-binding protein [Chloroflexota bacterium]|nr:NAD(P)H-binding protein [Chloroflexota bacterium]
MRTPGETTDTAELTPHSGSECVLVVGGTGALGAPVTRRLAADGYGVRVLARNVARARASLGAYVEIAPGDVEDERSVARAVEGCVAVHVSLAAGSDPELLERVEHRGTAQVAVAAARAGVRCLTYLSGMYVSPEFATHSPAERAKWNAEQAIRASGVPYVIFRPTYFMDTLPRHVQGRRAVVIGRQPHALHMVAAEDFAGMVSRAFRTPAASGRELFVHGPEAVTIRAALETYCRIVEPEVRVVTIPLPVMAAVNRLALGGRLTREITLMRVMQRVGERGDAAETNHLFGTPPTTLREWCERRRAACHQGVG